MRAVLWSWLVAVAAGAYPPIVDGPFPRAFFFRASEGRARQPATVYDAWSAEFGRLSGIMGKVFNEEIPGTAPRNVEFFAKFAADHPEQAVFLHYNGLSRDPRDAAGYSAEHWLYWTGAMVTADVTPEATVVAVDDVAPYRVNTGLHNNRNDDLMIARYVDGRIDWRHCEQLELVSIDAAAKTLTVRRGAFGTRPLAFEAGRAVVQAHVTDGPWGERNNLLWVYNWCADAPRDAAGRTAADLFVAEFVRRFAPGGELAAFSGVEFDVLMWSHDTRRGAQGVDSDGDNQVDGGLRDGLNAYGRGVLELCRRLREALPDKLWMGDGHDERNQRAVPWLNGIESEGWPHLNDPEIEDWSGGLNRHNYWTQFAHAPRFSYVNHKAHVGGEQVRTALHLARLVQAACCLTDSAFTFSMTPPGPQSPLPIYDELIGGTAAKPGWLGRPRGPATPLHTATVPLEWTGAPGPDLALATDGELRSCVASVVSDGNDLALRCRLRAAPPAGMPAGVPRLVHVSLVDPGDLLHSVRPWRAGVSWPDGSDGPLDPADGALARLLPRAVVAGEARRAMFLHPPYLRRVGAVWFEQDVTLPAGARLRFATGLPQRPGRSDGVTFTVSVRVGEGPWEKVFERHHASYDWQAAEVDLSEYGGRTVTLRIAAGAGPEGDAVADHGHLADLRVATPERDPLGGDSAATRRIMSWAGPEWFEASFWFRALQPGRYEIWFEAEPGGAVEVQHLQAVPGPDVWWRAFDGGMVIANPSRAPVEMNVAALAGGRRLRRLRATPGQDPAANDGNLAGERVVVPPRDALFLRSDP